jgi:two-component system, NtrC family, response regulator HupR/HoxA
MDVPADRKACLLVVDDEHLNRDLVRRLLQREYEIEEAGDAAEASLVLERLGATIAMVLCDQLMPGRSGTDLAAEVRRRWPHVRFVLITGYDEDPRVVEAHANGLVAEVISKPWKSAILRARIAELLAAG